MLNAMAGGDLEASMRLQAKWGIRDLDLKDSLFGKRIEDLDEKTAQTIASLANELGQHVCCFSSTFFSNKVESYGPKEIKETLDILRQMLLAARILKPTFIRLIASSTANLEQQRAELHSKGAGLDALFAGYREAIDLIADAGFQATIENECHGCIMITPEDVELFMARLDRPGRVNFTWDVQNMWQMGTFPTLEIYKRLKPLIGYYHVKGGHAGDDGRTLTWKATLEDASWPVLDITRQVLADGISPVICINPSHGADNPKYSMDRAVERDIAFLRTNLA